VHDVPGNLAQHAYQSHAGCTVYASVMNGSIILCENGRYTNIDGLYQDKFGNSYTTLYKEFTKYDVDLIDLTLNLEILNDAMRILEVLRIKSKICGESIRRNAIWRRWYK